ncbi:RNA methyltransferase [Mogibacterium neglectum]|uniref:TrmH family RNA methyltransferase n=1 Tax=Mogibacterium neglectum TaxID=114528 RepID=UPI00272D59D5|nr:RNA methyltransferase [Mogibacterium neglectum]WLD76813.1 RNA methyltransferase [Mogibacterium neglectum]
MEAYNEYGRKTNDESYRFISSPDNDKIRRVNKLSRKKYRDKKGEFVIEGINLVRAALSKSQHIKLVLISDDFDYGEIADALAEDVDYRNIYLIPRFLFDKISDAENGAGIMAVVDKRSYSLKTITSLEPIGTGNILVLDRLQDPGNIGTMIRTAVATGYSVVATLKGTADIYSPKVLRASAGMIFGISVIELADAEELKGLVSVLDKKIVVTDPREGCPYYECNLENDIALIIGNEGNGVSDEIMECSDVRVTIPMQGEVESLNAAICASILMYEAVRADE